MEENFDNMMEKLEKKMMEYESTIQTMTTIIFCLLKQSDNKIVINQKVVEEIVNRMDLNEFEFEFKVLDNGDGELILIPPDEVDGAKRVQKLRDTLPN